MNYKKITKSGKYNCVAGTYYPINPDKYTGDADPRYKSRLEHKFMSFCDRNSIILKWSYERIIIPYVDESRNNTRHNYYIDFKILMSTASGPKTFLVEIKSKQETISPVKTKRKKPETYQKEVQSWIRNQCKWKTATMVAKKQGWEFKVLTEDSLG